MTNLDYSKELNSFSFNYNLSSITYINDETKQRIIISKLYYALVHYYFMEYPEVATSTGTQQHERLLLTIEKNRNDNEYQLFKTLKILRVWADYKPLDSAPFPINLQRRLHQVFKTIN